MGAQLWLPLPNTVSAKHGPITGLVTFSLPTGSARGEGGADLVHDIEDAAHEVASLTDSIDALMNDDPEEPDPDDLDT